MAEGIKDQIFLLTPFIKDLEQAGKKDKPFLEVVKNALNGLDYEDIEPSIELLVNHISDKNPEIQLICIHAFQDLFTSKQFDFFLSANYSDTLLKSLINIIETTKSKLPIFNEACQCLNYFILSSNQQLYVHDDDLEFLLSKLLEIHSKNPDELSRKSIENILKRFLHNLESLASRSSNNVDQYISKDIKSSADSLVKCIQLPSIVPETAKLILSLLNSIVFDSPQIFKNSEAYQHILIVEIPQLFIQYSLLAHNSVFPSVLEFFTQYIALDQKVLASFPTIIDQMITPAIEAQNELSLRALSMLNKFCRRKDNPDLISVFAISDCSEDECKRVFETVFQAVTKMAMDNASDPSKVNACLSFLNKALSSFQIFFRDLKTCKSDSTFILEKDLLLGEVLDKKMTVEGCAKAFNESPSKGIVTIINSNLAENSPKSLAIFIKNCQLLEPAVVSDFLSRPQNSEILKEYINTFDFKNMSIDIAIRELCSQFRLPGESQQIDRVMQSFASKYHDDNTSMSEDAAYVLSFSIIMLHTDIHNPNVVKKITCDEWIDNTRNVKEACEVDISILKGIYSRIVAKPMKDGALSPYAEASKLKRRGKKQLQKLLSQKQKKITVTREILILAFDRMWSTIFAAFSFCMQGIPEDKTVTFALNGQAKLAFFLSHFRMTKELETVISFVCAFSTSAETNHRRIKGINTILTIIQEDADNLGDTAWMPILELFSSLMRNSSPLDIANPVEQDIQITQSDTVLNVPVDKIERVYQSTTTLDRFSYISFVKCLCQVSISEVFMNPPSLYSFQKIIDIAIANVSRVRFVWSESWNIFYSHFCRVGCLGHPEIAMFTVSQLVNVVKAISIDPEKWQHFQREALTPYCTIFQNQTLYEPRRYIIAALSHIIGRDIQISKAWDILLDIFEIAASDKSTEIVQRSFELLESGLATVPNEYINKLTIVLMKMGIQTVVPNIRVSSMSYSIPFAMKVNPITLGLFEVVQNAINCDSKEVMALATDLYYHLILKYNSETWDTIMETRILPLFATPKKDLQVHLMRGLFRILLPQAGEKTFSLLPQITKMFIEVNDVVVLNPLITELLTIACENNSNESDENDKQKLCRDMLETIFNSSSVKYEMLETFYANVKATPKLYDIIVLSIQQSMNLQKIVLLKKGVELFFSVEDISKTENDTEKTAHIIISVLMFINSQFSSSAVELLLLINNELLKSKFECVRCKRIEFQRAIFGFYMNDSRALREIAQKMAEGSQILFVDETEI